ncbi:J domain-containing protein [Myxococcota bacterium]|nr:J domain-containing protein [Myxococcota bacterium]
MTAQPPNPSSRKEDEAFREIASFLRLVGHSTLFDYYDLDKDAAPEETRHSLDERRRWAQSQQSNPKFQEEARWLIRHHALVSTVLLDRRELYLKRIEQHRLQRSLDMLTLFVRGALRGETLTAEAEAVVLDQAKSLGVPQDIAQEHISRALRERGGARAPTQAAEPPRTHRASQTMVTQLREIVSRGDLSPIELERILVEGRKREMSEQAILQAIDLAAQRSARRRAVEKSAAAAAPAPDPEAAPPAAPTSPQANPLDEQLRSDAIRELVDTVRGAMLMGVLTMSTLSSLQRRGGQLGLDQRTVQLAVTEAKLAGEDMSAGKLDPYAVMQVAETVDQDTLRQAYQDQRRWALGLPNPTEGVRACVRIDMAWSLVKDPRSRARYDQRRKSGA